MANLMCKLFCQISPRSFFFSKKGNRIIKMQNPEGRKPRPLGNRKTVPACLPVPTRSHTSSSSLFFRYANAGGDDVDVDVDVDVEVVCCYSRRRITLLQPCWISIQDHSNKYN